MTRQFTASLVKQGGWIVAQCLEVDVASQGKTEDEALANLGEALELFTASRFQAFNPGSFLFR